MYFYVSHAPIIVLTDHILDTFDLSIDCYVKMTIESILIFLYVLLYASTNIGFSICLFTRNNKLYYA